MCLVWLIVRLPHIAGVCWIVGAKYAIKNLDFFFAFESIVANKLILQASQARPSSEGVNEQWLGLSHSLAVATY